MVASSMASLPIEASVQAFLGVLINDQPREHEKSVRMMLTAFNLSRRQIVTEEWQKGLRENASTEMVVARILARMEA